RATPAGQTNGRPLHRWTLIGPRRYEDIKNPSARSDIESVRTRPAPGVQRYPGVHPHSRSSQSLRVLRAWLLREESLRLREPRRELTIRQARAADLSGQARHVHLR